jgi:hypothetical protein
MVCGHDFRGTNLPHEPGGSKAGVAGSHRDESIAWAWAVKGFFSVISSIASTIFAMTVGFKLLLWIAIGVYVVGVAAPGRVPPPPMADG